MTIATMLKGHDLFRSLTVEEVDRVSRFSAAKSFAAGEWVYRFEAPGSHVFLLQKGMVHLRLPAGESELGMVVSKVEQGYFFGLAPILGAERYNTGAQCAQACEVLAIEARPLRALLQENSTAGLEFMGAVARAYADRYVGLLDRLQAILQQLPLIP
jgi:CRP-like cAMP-binding protein